METYKRGTDKWMSTPEVADTLMMSTKSVYRIYKAKRHLYGVVPEIEGMRKYLKWDRLAILKLSVDRQLDCGVMMQALQGMVDWLNEQRIDTGDSRVGFAYEVVKQMGDKYK